MGGGEGVLPLTGLPGRETTHDTVLLARTASGIPFELCFDLGTGSGAVLEEMSGWSGFVVGVDFSMGSLLRFDPRLGQRVLCRVEDVPATFRKHCADLVIANPPYHVTGRGRRSPVEERNSARFGGPLTVFRFIFAGAYLLKDGGVMVMTGREKVRDELLTGFSAAGFSVPEAVRYGGAWGLRASIHHPVRAEDGGSEPGGV